MGLENNLMDIMPEVLTTRVDDLINWARKVLTRKPKPFGQYFSKPFILVIYMFSPSVHQIIL